MFSTIGYTKKKVILCFYFSNLPGFQNKELKRFAASYIIFIESISSSEHIFLFYHQRKERKTKNKTEIY
jgi:hypothetical protein